MRKKDSLNYLIEERNRELQLAFERIRRELGVFCPMSEVYDRLQQEGARRFWVSGEHAYDRIVRRKKLRGRKQVMYEEIERIARRHQAINGVSFRDAVYWAVTRPAPSFYIDRMTMRNIVLKCIRR